VLQPSTDALAQGHDEDDDVPTLSTLPTRALQGPLEAPVYSMTC
jgi:hypothetical protein